MMHVTKQIFHVQRRPFGHGGMGRGLRIIVQVCYQSSLFEPSR